MIELLPPVLDKPQFYEFYHYVIGPNPRGWVLATEYIRPKPSDGILDIGCGTFSTLPFLPECKYISVGAILDYICTALDGTGVAESSFANA